MANTKAAAKSATKTGVKAPKKKQKKNINKGVVIVSCTYNNTLVTLTDLDGNVLSSSSGGVVGFKGSRKGTAFAATKAAEYVIEKGKQYGLEEALVKIKGSGMGRQAAVKGLRAAGLRIRTLMDVTPIRHGGCAPRKKTRGS